MQTAILQSVAVLTGVSPVSLRPVSPLGPGGEREDEAVGRATAPGPRGSDVLDLSPVAAGGDADAENGADDEAAGREAAADQARPSARPTAGPTARPTDGRESRPEARPESGPEARPEPRSESESRSEPAAVTAPPTSAADTLTEDEEKRVQELKARDTEVRTHEQAHKAAGGRYAGSITYEYTEGPDGRRYATGGSVSIDASPVAGDPEATISKMRIIRAAALAPAEPSSQDRKVAAQADRTAAKARQELATEQADEAREPAESDASGSDETRTPEATNGPDAARDAADDIGRQGLGGREAEPGPGNEGADSAAASTDGAASGARGTSGTAAYGAAAAYQAAAAFGASQTIAGSVTSASAVATRPALNLVA